MKNIIIRDVDCAEKTEIKASIEEFMKSDKCNTTSVSKAIEWLIIDYRRLIEDSEQSEKSSAERIQSSNTRPPKKTNWKE